VGTSAEDRPGEASAPLLFGPESLKCTFEFVVRLSCNGLKERICHHDSAVTVAMRGVSAFLKCSVLNFEQPSRSENVTLPLITLLAAFFITSHVHTLYVSVLLYCSM
jgi:hypothetical protein